MTRSIIASLAGILLLASLSACSHTATNSLESSDYVGAWKVADTQGKPFYIQFDADGTAKNTWGKGETGHWQLVDGSARVVWSSGWTDVLSHDCQRYTKSGYRPGTAPPEGPADTGPAERVAGIPHAHH